MPEDIYEVLALGMRYWFALLGLLVVLRAFLWQWKEHHERRVRRRQLPDAGMVGELLVLRGSPELPEGTAIALPYEGVLGFVRSCDVAVPCNHIAAQHLDFSFQPGVGVLVCPRFRCACLVGGVKVTPKSRPRLHPLVQGSVLTVGEAELEVRLFSGLAARLRARPQRADVHPEMPEQRLFDQPVKHVDETPVKPGQRTLFGQPVPPDAAAPQPEERRRRRGEKEKK